jgi:tetratricopeptide (TPR) repeat protein
MDDPRYRKQPLPAALNVRKHDRAGGWLDWPRLGVIPALVLAVWFAGSRIDRQPPPPSPPPPPPLVPAPASPVAGLKVKLAATRVETALAKLDQKRPDEALALLVTALHADPQAEDARQLAERVLCDTTWHFPVLELQHPVPVERIAQAAAPSELWVGLAGALPTLVRWNLDALRIESVMFPLPDAVARSLVVDPTGRRLVIERAGVLLLCDALTLKPLRDLGKLPQAATPSSVIVFSADGLLLAHPVVTEDPQPSWIWQIRDTASGEVLRSSEPVAADLPQPLSAHLGRRGLRVLHADGRLREIPISPVEPEIVTPAPEPVRLLHACHAEDGETARVLKDRGPHQAPELVVFPEGMPAAASLEAMALLERFPWSRHPGIWTGLLRDGAGAPIVVDGRGLDFTRENTSPVFTSSAITAVAVRGPLWMIACADGTLAFQRRLPLPVASESPTGSTEADVADVAAFDDLTAALAAVVHDEAGRRFVRVDAAERRRRYEACDFSALRRLFPSLDFQPLIDALQDHAPRTPPDDAIKPLLDRLARANPAHAMVPAAANLQAALASPDPVLLRESLEVAQNIPPLVRKLAESRIAWLEDRRGDAMAGWPDEFPDPAQVRLREDWDGWEQVDLRHVLETFHNDMHGELAKLELPADHDAEQRLALLERLTDPETLRAAGRRRLAGACLKAALAFSQIASEAEATLVLASLARTHGGAPEACLRAEARALSQLGEHTKAHDRWILLLTEYPVATHEPADYADAAYTAFEVSDARQAMEILTSGLQRFPENPDFALRAGWIALLTGNPERAYGFLLAGRQTGYPADQVEHATVLLTIAATQSGQTDDATALFEELIALNPAWSDPRTIEDLGWPDELKATLRQLTW